MDLILDKILYFHPKICKPYVPRAGSPGYIFVLRAGSPVYIFVLRAGSPNVPSCN